MNRGKFITFEGADGVGKSTQVELLSEYLKEQGINVNITREPGGNEFGESIRDIWKKNSTNIDAISDTLLLFAGRREHFVKVIRPKLEKGEWVLCDRFYDSTLVYQGRLREVSVEQIMQLKQMTLGEFEPDFTVVLDLDYECSIRHMQTRDVPLDAYDKMGEEKYNIVRDSFKKLAQLFSYRTALIKGDGAKDKVFLRILKEIKKRNLLENINIID